MEERKAELERLKLVVRDIYEANRTFQIATRVLQEATDQLKPVKEMMKHRSSGKPGWKLVKLGTMLVVIPVPVVTEVPGALLIATGMLMNKFMSQGMGILDVYDEFNDLIRELHRVKKEI